MTFEEAKHQYIYRYTMDHVPAWVQFPAPNGKYYAPQYRTDKEWYENTVFSPNPLCSEGGCFSNNPSWPLGQWLDTPYRKEPNQ